MFDHARLDEQDHKLRTLLTDQQAAGDADTAARHAAEVSRVAYQISGEADRLLEAAGSFSVQAGRLREELDRFVAEAQVA